MTIYALLTIVIVLLLLYLIFVLLTKMLPPETHKVFALVMGLIAILYLLNATGILGAPLLPPR